MLNKVNMALNEIILYLKKVLKNKVSILLILFPILSVIPIMIFFPIWAGSPFMVEINVILSTGVLFSYFTYNWRKSTLYKNSYLNGGGKALIYISSLLSILIIITFSSILQLILIYMLNDFNLIMVDWVFGNPNNRSVVIENINFGGWIWGIFWITMITFSLSFFFQRFLKSEKEYFFFLVSILVFSFVFGGSLNDFYPWVINVDIGHWTPKMKRGLYPLSFFPVSLAFPFYAPGQVISVASDFSIAKSSGEQWDVYKNFEGSLIRWTSVDFYDKAMNWNIVILSPIIWTVLLGLSGTFLSLKKEKL